MRKINCAIIGVGIWGENHIKVYKSHPKVDSLVICDMNEEKVKAMAKKYNIENYYVDYNEMFAKEKIDAVSVATPDFAHKDPVVAALNNKCHVLVEKPLATTLEDCNIMVETADKNGVNLMTDFHSRWVLPFLGIKKTVESGEIGKPMHANIRLSDTAYVPRKMLKWMNKSSSMWFLGCHTIDLLRWVFSDEISNVYCVSENRVFKSEGINCPDYFQSLLKFKNGGSALMENTYLLPEKSYPSLFDFRFEVVGERGTVTATPVLGEAFAKYTDTPNDDPYYPKQDMFFGPACSENLAGGAYDSIRYFIDTISKNGKLSVTGIDGLKASKVILAALESIEKGEVINIDY
jgi:predicted dehydrogenase